jgi:predicted nucleotidyltransferase
MSEELSTIIRRNVDLVERRLVERNRNYIIRKHILRSAEPVYVA